MSYCPDCKQDIRIGGPAHTCPESREREALGPSDATDCSPRVLATKIAMSLFTNGFGGEGTRLEIKEGDGYGKETSLGGWCFQAAVDQIEKAIIEENSKLSQPEVE